MCGAGCSQLSGESQIRATIPRAFPPPSWREFIPVLILPIPQPMPSFQSGESPDPLPPLLVRSPYAWVDGRVLLGMPWWSCPPEQPQGSDGTLDMDMEPITERLSFASPRKSLREHSDIIRAHGGERVGASHGAFPLNPGAPPQSQGSDLKAQSSHPASLSLSQREFLEEFWGSSSLLPTRVLLRGSSPSC